MSTATSEILDRVIDFGSVEIDMEVERVVCFENNGQSLLTYRISTKYILNSIDRVFKALIENSPVSPGKVVRVKILFKPKLVGQTYTEYFILDDTDGNFYKLTVTGKSFGPRIVLGSKKIVFNICKQSFFNKIQEEVELINKSNCEVPYQWILPSDGRGYFEMTSGYCGVIRSLESITCTVVFTGNILGVYAAEFVCLVLNQNPLFLNVVATVTLNSQDQHKQKQVFHRNWSRKCEYTHLMENSLKHLEDIPSASVYDRYLDFGTGSVSDITLNISKTLCVTNHKDVEGFMQWMPDPGNIFQIDPISIKIMPKESTMFTIRFRPKKENEIYSFILFGDCQHSVGEDSRLHHTWFRIPCTGDTIPPCSDWPTEYICNTEITLPPTVPWRTTFTNFMLSNKLDAQMHFKFEQPDSTTFAIMPMCGLIQNRGWQIISVALQPKSFGDFYENWHLIINRNHEVRICLSGNAEDSRIQISSDDNYNVVDCSAAGFEFRPTVTGCTSSVTAFLHNPTRMHIHVRIINTVEWLGADDCGCTVVAPRGVKPYNLWFYPTTAEKIYSTIITCSCVTLINGKVAGEPYEVFIPISGFSELSDLKVLPRTINLHDIVVGDRIPFSFSLHNSGTCSVTSKLCYSLTGMDDDHSKDSILIANKINSLKPSHYCTIDGSVMSNSAGPRQIDVNYSVIYLNDLDNESELIPTKNIICTIWYDGIYPTIQVKRTISTSCPVTLSNHCAWNILNINALNKALVEVRPNNALTVNLYAPDLCIGAGTVKMILVLGCVYAAPVEWILAREKLCDCEMTEEQLGISLYRKKHNCIHRQLIELRPINDTVFPNSPCLLYLKCKYKLDGENVLRYKLTMSNARTLYLDFHIYAHPTSRGTLVPLRRPIDQQEYLAVLDCGKVPINNLDPVVRIVWLYNPTKMYTTWRLLQGNCEKNMLEIRCLLYFAEVGPLGRLAIPFAFMPTEMIDYEYIFHCSFGYDIIKILVKGQGGLPNCIETRLDIPKYVEKNIRKAHCYNTVHLSLEHITIPVLPTYSLSREILAINNDTEHIIRFIWLPERLSNIVNIVMTPCWGAIQPKSSHWITMSVYTLQEPATFTITVSCEILDLTERSQYQRNETLRKIKTEKCNQEFIITEKGTTRPEINDSPPFVMELKKPEPNYLALSVSISSKGQRDGYARMNGRQLFEQVPAYDLQSNEDERNVFANSLSTNDIIQVIDGILWDVLHSKMFKHQIEYYSKEQIPNYEDLMKAVDAETRPELSKRVTSGICDAIVNKAVFHVYGLNPKQDMISLLDM